MIRLALTSVDILLSMKRNNGCCSDCAGRLISKGGGGGEGGGGYSDIFTHTLAQVFFGGFEFIIFGGFQKNEYILGMKILWIFFWGGGGVITNWTKFRGHFYAFYGLFLRSRDRMVDIFFGLVKFQIFFWGA